MWSALKFRFSAKMSCDFLTSESSKKCQVVKSFPNDLVQGTEFDESE